MSKTFRSQVVLALVVAVGSAVSFADSGEATYKAKCQSCHGSAGVPSPGIAKALGVKPATDPDIKKLTVDAISTVILSGKGKMKPITGLTPAQAKDTATYYKSLAK
jgi:mono/diheme cytochrome c family protein